jgi:hypothetical protein
MTPTKIKYYSVYGDSDDRNEFYYGKENYFHFESCTSCKKVIDRKDVIQIAIPFYKSRFSRLFYYTWDGVPIVSKRFVDIYQKYNLNGLTFYLIPRLKDYYVMQCDNVVRFDTKANPNFEMTKVCGMCGRPDGAYRPYPYKIIDEDELKINPLTFYESDIEFGDKHTQSPLLFAPEDVLLIFKKECGRIFFETAENGKSKIIDCKGK